MDESPTPAYGAPAPPIKKKLLVTILLVLTLLLLATSGYLWMQLKDAKDAKTTLERDKRQLQVQVDTLRSAASPGPAPAPSPQACNDTPTIAMKNNIKAALDSGNTAVFATYVADPTRFVLAASEEGGDKTPAQIVISMEYTKGGTAPWDFSIPPATIAAYEAGFYKDYFDANTYVGRSADKMIAAFDFDCAGKIKQIFVAAHEDLLL